MNFAIRFLINSSLTQSRPTANVRFQLTCKVVLGLSRARFAKRMFSRRHFRVSPICNHGHAAV